MKTPGFCRRASPSRSSAQPLPASPGCSDCGARNVGTDLSWPKNTVNILGSVLCSLMVQDANTPKPTSYTQSLAPKEITVFAPHEKLDPHPKPRRGTSGAEGYWWMARKRTQPRRARHVAPAEPPGSETRRDEAAGASLLILGSSWSRVRAVRRFLLLSLPNPPLQETVPAPGADFHLPPSHLPAPRLCPRHPQTQFISSFLVAPS